MPMTKLMASVNRNPCVLSIAGFDPSGGAGILADIKTFEMLSCYGLAVQTANTIQVDNKIDDCHWTPLSILKNQLELLFSRFFIRVVKIGIIENEIILNEIITFLRNKNNTIKIILDPILSSSSSFHFHSSNYSQNIFCDEILGNIDLLTPNALELSELNVTENLDETINFISSRTNLLLKGGHRKSKKGIDTLFLKEGKVVDILPKNKECNEKHGSGCVLSAAIVAFLARDYNLEVACQSAKSYVEDFLNSSTSLLGIHFR